MRIQSNSRSTWENANPEANYVSGELLVCGGGFRI